MRHCPHHPQRRTLLAATAAVLSVGALAASARLAQAQSLPGVRLVRAFTSVPHSAVLAEAHRSGERIGVPLATADPAALKLAECLVRDAGFDPVLVGGLARSKDFDVGTPVFGRALSARELRQTLGLVR